MRKEIKAKHEERTQDVMREFVWKIVDLKIR